MDVDRAILATLAYYNGFSWPLTLAEIFERLIPPRRVGSKADPPKMAAVQKHLDTLVKDGKAQSAMGMYAPAGAGAGIFAARVTREKEHAQKWRRVRRWAWGLQIVPYVRALLGSGSLALGNTGSDSDWDVLIIARSGRLYTARAGLLLVAWTMRRLRTKHDSVAPDRFCFNHYLTTENLAVRHRSLFTAHALSWLIPLHDPDGYLGRLRQANQWTADYIGGNAGTRFVRRSVTPSAALRLLRSAAEWILDSFVGGWVERILRRWQQGRIEREPATHERGGRVIADEREIEFHPRSAERHILDRYNAALAGLGIARREADSGLAH